MHKILAAAIGAALLISTSVFAADVGGPLPAGRPAGVQKAQDTDNTLWWVIGAGAIAAGIALVASGSNNGSGGSTTVTTTTTS
jgi:hypothetical protein